MGFRDKKELFCLSIIAQWVNFLKIGRIQTCAGLSATRIKFTDSVVLMSPLLTCWSEVPAKYPGISISDTARPSEKSSAATTSSVPVLPPHGQSVCVPLLCVHLMGHRDPRYAISIILRVSMWMFMDGILKFCFVLHSTALYYVVLC